jgi:S-adenosylmethionine:tRNA ribosyltransferase-isomerase
LKTADFDYHLPEELIAQTPAEPRDSSRLMVLDRSTGKLEHRAFRELESYVRPGDLMVLNDTRVIPARLAARKKRTGGQVEILLLERDQNDQQWLALVGGRRVRVGTELELVNRSDGLPGPEATVLEERSGSQRIIRFDRPTGEWLERYGQMPLPPYIHSYSGDPERYQTVYSRHEGSAAAPTAGLHMSSELLFGLREAGVNLAYVTLRIGLDTFKPIEEEEIVDHRIHTEWARLSPETARQINETRLSGRRVIAVGTTVVRTLETAAKIANPDTCDGKQCGWATVSAFEGSTDLFIIPGFRFRAVDALLTNFHLPRSTLILLVSAFAGQDTIREAYAQAIAMRYRFYSFGDAMLIL